VKYNRICYFTNWGAHRSIKDSRVYPEDIPADLCTHILYAFANLNGLSLQPQIANDDKVYQGEKVSENDVQ
jgi:chitinase